MLVSEIMAKPVYSVSPDSTIIAIASELREKKVGSIIVLDSNRRAVGIVTERDLVERVIAEEKDIHTTKARDVMSSPLVSIHPNQTIEAAAALMSDKKIKNLIVVEDDTMLGIITASDLISAQPKLSKDLFETWVKPDWR